MKNETITSSGAGVPYIIETMKKELRGSKRVLNMACGNSLKPGFLKGVGAKFYGVDVDRNLAGGNVKYCDVDRDSLPFKDSSFDAVLCMFGVEHFKNPERAFKETSRVLKSKGKFIFVTTNSWNPLFAINRLLNLRKTYFLLALRKRESYGAYYKCNTVLEIVRKLKALKAGRIVLLGCNHGYFKAIGMEAPVLVMEKILYKLFPSLRPTIYASFEK